MTIEDIVKAENDNDHTIILFREGIFWKAYEKSAYAFCKHIKTFLIKKKFIKSINEEIVSIGFPISSTQMILQGRPILLEEEKKMIVSIGSIDQEEFLIWKKEQVLTVAPTPVATTGTTHKNTPTVLSVSNVPELSNPEKEALTRIRLFSLESKTPLECMIFLSEIKKQLLI